VIGRYREQLEHSATKLEAARRTVEHMALASFLTTGTTAVGLASLITSQTELLRRFGVIAAGGVMIAYVSTILFIPAAMTYFKPPLPPRNRPGRAIIEVDRGWLDKGIVWLTAKILRRPWYYLAGSAIATGLCIWAAFYVVVDSSLLDEFEEGDSISRSTQLMERQLDGVRPLEIMLTADADGRFEDPAVLAAIDAIEHWIQEQPGVLSTLSPTDYLHESWAQVTGDPEARTERFRNREQVAALMLLFEQIDRNPLDVVLSEDGRVARVQVRLADIGARASLGIIRRLEHRLDRRFRPLGIDVAMTGEGYTGSVGLDAIINDLLGSLGTAVIIIFGMMVVLFRSVRLGLLSVPPNILPLVGAVAWMAIRGIPLNAATVIVFSISLGLAVDASIHILARFREETGNGLLWRPAILRSARGTGSAIVISCTTLMVGFGVMLLSSFVPVRRFGELIAVSIALSLVSTLIVQPAMLRIGLGKSPARRREAKEAKKKKD
jgi:predicted RND superfamily exporter protein